MGTEVECTGVASLSDPTPKVPTPTVECGTEEGSGEKDEEKPCPHHPKKRKVDAVSIALRKRQVAEIVLSKFFRKNKGKKNNND